jgi:hypothetical protein
MDACLRLPRRPARPSTGLGAQTFRRFSRTRVAVDIRPVNGETRAMRLALLASFAPLLMPMPALAASKCDGDAATCRAIEAAEEAFTRMLVTGDPAAFATHLDERAIYVTANGQRHTRPEMVALVRTGPRHAAARLAALEVRQFGDTAVAVWTEAWTDPGGGGSTSGIDTWQRRGGRWRVIATREARNAK